MMDIEPPPIPPPNPTYGYLADALVVVHFAFMGFIVFGQLAIIIASAFKWQWGRNPWFRYLHLACILFVVYESIYGIECPLTTLERHWRTLAGQEMGGSSTFIGYYAHKWLFWGDGNGNGMTPSEISIMTICFGIIVAQGVVMFPPRWFRRYGKGKEAAKAPG